MHNYVCPVQCVELHCPLTEAFTRAYATAQTLEEERMLYSTNPNKVLEEFANLHKILTCDIEWISISSLMAWETAKAND